MKQRFEIIYKSFRKHIDFEKSLVSWRLKLFLGLVILTFSATAIHAQKSDLNLDQKIAQLFAYELKREDFKEDFKTFKKDFDEGLGMLIVSFPLNESEVIQINRVLKPFDLKPIIVFKNTKSSERWPSALSVGAVSDNQILSNWSEKMGLTLSNSGYHFSYSEFPGVSKTQEAKEALEYSINEDWEIVQEKVLAIESGFKKTDIKTIIPDFPGFRNQSTDFAFKVNFDESRIKSIEMKPYEALINDGADVIQVSASLVKDKSETFIPFFLSTDWTEKTLRKELGFKGLVLSADITNVSKWYDAKNGEIELMAFENGNDLLLNPENVNAARRRIRALIKKSKKYENQLNDAVQRILTHKGNAKGESKLAGISFPVLEYEDILRKSITVMDDNDIIPLAYLDTKKIACVHIGIEYPNLSSVYLDKYDRIKHFYLRDRFNYYEKFQELINSLESFDVVILPLGNIPFDPSENYGIGNQIPRFVRDISDKKDVIILAHGNPIIGDLFPNRVSHIIAYDTGSIAQKLLPQILFGAKRAYGKLPFSTEKYAWNSGKMTKSLNRLDYVYPQEVGMDPSILAKIEDVVQEALEDKATPGCQILVAKDGHIVLEKGYGYLSYDSVVPVSTETVYDVASITKVAATLQGVMLLTEMDVINVNKTASQYLYDLRASNKDDLYISEILSHQAGLTPYIPYWKQTLDGEGLDDRYYCDNPDDWFCVEVVPGIYTIRTMEDSLWKWTLESELREKNKDGNFGYRYSDLGFYIMKKLVERRTRQPIEEFLEQNFYRPLGMSKMTFFPLAYFDEEEIAPTEQDDYFRHTMVRGTVHDQGAAMFGGVGGHAGLFSNSIDLAKLLQMHLNKGTYGGQRYLRPETVETFAQRHFKNNRRGLGWDKPLRSGNGPSSDLCSYNTFGHTGFTGTAMWADPDYNLIYVFLSNRIHPDVNNRKLIKQNIRTRIQDIVYESIFINDINLK
ncbi:MAG: serine hydrolase [Cytophagales bacterium]